MEYSLGDLPAGFMDQVAEQRNLIEAAKTPPAATPSLPPLPDLSNVPTTGYNFSTASYSSPAWNWLSAEEDRAKLEQDTFLKNLEWGWRSTVGGGTRPESYAFTFNSPEGYYTFVPDSIIERGLSTPTGNTYWFPSLLNENNLKEFFKDAKRVDFTGVPDKTFGGTYADYLVNETNVSPTGYLIPGESARFDSEVKTAPTESLGGGITGLGRDQAGNLVYGLNNGRIDASGNATIRQPQSTNWFQDLAGGITDLFTSLGPVAPFLLNLAAPGIGTAISVGLNLGKGNIEGAILSGATGSIGQGIASAIRPEIASAFANAGLDAATTNLLTDATTRSLTAGTMAGLTGGDVGAAMKNAALNAGFGSLTGPPAPTQEDINAVMNLGGTPEQIDLTQDIGSFMDLGGTPEQQVDTALLDYQTQYEAELNKALGAVPQDIYPINIPQEPPTSYETGIGLPGEEAAAQSLGGFGGTGNILGLEDYEERAGKDLAAAQEQLASSTVPDITEATPKLPSIKSPSATKPPISNLINQAKSAQQSYNQMLDQYLMSQPVSVPFIANIPQTDLEEMFSGQTPIYWQGQA
jgi:hypothetical protein